MKVVHWSLCNGSGMHNVAKSMVQAELALGVESVLINIETESAWEQAFDADVHVSHTHVPVTYKGKRLSRQVTKPMKIVGVFHGTPEHVFRGSVEAGLGGRYAPPNSLMIQHHDLQTSDALVTFWPRHKAIYETMVDKGRIVHCVPMGVDKELWAGGASRGKYQGTPSVLTCENSHDIKWPFDLFTMWKWISDEVDEAYLHALYVPHDQHRYWFPLVFRNQCYYRAHIGPWTYEPNELRNILKSNDFYCGLVEKGDFNRMSLEANAAGGCKTISYAGNEYSDFWVPEGDQRIVAAEFIRILRGEVEPRAKTPVPSLADMGQAMVGIYEDVLDRPRTNFAVNTRITGGLDPVIAEALASSHGVRGLQLAKERGELPDPVVVPPLPDVPAEPAPPKLELVGADA